MLTTSTSAISTAAATSSVAAASSVTTTTTMMSTTTAMSAVITFSSVSSVAYITLTTYEVRVQVSLTKYFTFTDPYFDTDLTVNSQRKYVGVVDIHTQGMQWCTTLFDLFGTGNFSTTQTTGDLYFDTFSTHAQCRSDCHFNGT